MRFILKFHRQEVFHGEVISIWKSRHGNGMKCLFHVTWEQRKKKTHLREKSCSFFYQILIWHLLITKEFSFYFLWSEDIHINNDRTKINSLTSRTSERFSVWCVVGVLFLGLSLCVFEHFRCFCGSCRRHVQCKHELSRLNREQLKQEPHFQNTRPPFWKQKALPSSERYCC